MTPMLRGVRRSANQVILDRERHAINRAVANAVPEQAEGFEDAYFSGIWRLWKVAKFDERFWDKCDWKCDPRVIRGAHEMYLQEEAGEDAVHYFLNAVAKVDESPHKEGMAILTAPDMVSLLKDAMPGIFEVADRYGRQSRNRAFTEFALFKVKEAYERHLNPLWRLSRY